MSGNSDKDEEVLEGSGAGQNGDHDDDAITNGIMPIRSSLHDQEDNYEKSSSVHVDPVKHINGSEQVDSEDVQVVEDAGKEDMFVDAPDELSSNDGRNAEVGKPMPFFDNQEILAEEHDQSHESHFADEVERLRAMLEKAIAEKEVLIWENKEQEGIYAKELDLLHSQLKALTLQQPLIGENDAGSFDGLNEEETGNGEISLSEMINRCFKSLRSATEAWLQSEGTIRELHETISAKDKEFEDLNAKVNELSLARDTAASLVQNEKDQQLDAVLSNILASLNMVVYQEELLDDSVAGKVSLVERSVYGLIQNYNWFLSETDQLRQCLNEVGSDRAQEEFGAVFVAARDELLGFRRKEAEFIEKLAQLEGENKELIEKLAKEKGIEESVNAELVKVKTELEQEKAKCANVKEKLAMAVTKGKALVQQRDSLRLSLTEKTRELEKSMGELQDKSSALEASELCKEELAKRENLVASLQEKLSQWDMVLANFEEILSQTIIPDRLQSTDISEKIKWLVDDRNELASVSLEFDKLKNALLTDMPETVSSLDLESRVGWLRESLFCAKDEVSKMHDGIARIRDAANNEIDHLTASLSAEIQEKEYLQTELDDHICKLQETVQKEHHLSFEKDEVVKILLDASGITLDNKEDVCHPSLSMPMLVNRCLEKMKEQRSASHESSGAEGEIFERVQTFLYVRDQELMLYEKLLEEEMLERSEVSKQLNELKLASEELTSIKNEKDSLQKDLVRAEEKTVLVREKLSMAVKKGKGIMQERENLKSHLDEKNKEIENFKLELQQQESTLSDYRDQISVLSIDVGRIPDLEATLISLTDQKGQIEKILMDINTVLQPVIESIDGVILPVDSMAEEPVEKVKCLWEILKGILDEKNKKIKKLEFELLQQESVLSDYKYQTIRLSNDMERIPSLEADLISVKDQRDQFEKILMNINNMLQRVVGSVDGVALPVDYVIEEPVEKLKWLGDTVKCILDEKNREIEKFKLELQQLEFASSAYRDQISRLSNDMEGISNLEADLVFVKKQKDLYEKILRDINKMLQRVIESVDGVALPGDYVIEESVEKANLLIGYFDKCQVAKTQAEKNLEKVKEKASALATKLAEADSTIKSLEDTVSVGENNLFRLAEEKKELELGKAVVDQALQKAVEEAKCHTSSFAEANAGRAAAEAELEKVQEEVAAQKSKLTEAYETIRSLEDTLVQLKTNISLLNEENNIAQIGRSNLENELRKLKDEINSQEGDLADAQCTIKALEEALLKMENSISLLSGEKKDAEEEISTLSSKLNACMEELSGTNGSMESRSLELFGHFNDIQALTKDGTMISLLKKGITTNYERLKSMDLLLRNIQDYCVEMSPGEPKSRLENEENPSVTEHFTDVLDNIANTEKESGDLNMVHGDDLTTQFRKALEGLRCRDKVLSDKFEGFFYSMDACSGSLLEKLKGVKDEIIGILEYMISLKHKVKDMETDKQVLESTIITLQNNLAAIISSCFDATKELEFEAENSLAQPTSGSETEKFDQDLTPEVREIAFDAIAGNQEKLGCGDYVETAQKFLLAARKVKTLFKQFANTKNGLDATIDDLQNELQVTKSTFEECTKERDLKQNWAFKLETELESSQSLCSQLKLKLEDRYAVENKLRERVEEVTSLYNNLLKKEQEAEDSILSPSQVNSLFDKISGIEISFADLDLGDTEPSDSVLLKKLFYVVDSIVKLHHQTNMLSHDKEELQSIVERRNSEIEHLKEEIDREARNRQDSEEMKSEFSEFSLHLEKIILKLGGNDIPGLKNPVEVKNLLSVLDKLVTNLILESESSKSKAHELSTMLLESQKVVDDLSSKVKTLEESLQSRTASPAEIVQERSIFEAPSLPSGSEIIEIEDVGSLGKNGMPPVPLAAQMRTLRKGSTDHLALNIDTESDSLISSEKTDEDKGHIFKSLNTSGLIPKQGKMIADRVDGIWVSGGRVLMSRPKARIGLIAYCLLLHIWLLGTIL